MTPGPKPALLWTCCACQLHVVLAVRPSQDILGVLSAGEREEQSNHRRFDSGMVATGDLSNQKGTDDGKVNCTAQKRAARHVLSSLRVLREEEGEGDHCRWPGISCDGCAVVRIDLTYVKEVPGTFHSRTSRPTTLHPDFKHLHHLERVDLSYRNLTGDIGIFRSLEKLKTVKLHNTQVAGDIMMFSSQKQTLSEGSNMTQLQHVDLSGTKVSGEVKNFRGSLKLTYLDLGGTRVTGDIETLNKCPLKHLKLLDTSVGGNIRVVQAFSDLIHLDLRNTVVFGDIVAFEATQKLQSLNLEFTGVFGDIFALGKARDLERLELSLTRVSGDIQVLEDKDNLTEIDFAATQIEGDVQAVRHLSHLCGLSLDGTKVKGDLHTLNSSNSLITLSISNTQVSGDLQALKHLTNLRMLISRSTPIRGSLSSIQGLDLIELDLSQTQIYGDISVLENKTNLDKVGLSSTRVTGDVAVFGHHPNLWSLDLSFTNVTGHIKVFKGHSALEELRMASTGVGGGLDMLVSFGTINAFETIDLSDTQVEGNIFVLKHAEALTMLHLQGTHVTGSIGGITGLEKAEVVDLSRTRVRGRLTQQWRGCCKHLRLLKLSDSGAEFMPAGTDLTQLMDLTDPEVDSGRVPDALLPALTTLEVSGCPLNGNLQHLILPLAFCGNLGSIIAVNTGLFGGLPNLDPLGPMRINGYLSLAWRSTLASSLEVLELSGNNLTLIESIPPSVRKLVVSSNQKPLRLAEGTLTSALKTGVSIDLRHTTLHAETRMEAETLLRENVMGRTAERTFERDGYTCFDLARDNTSLLVTPPEFLPEDLCDCVPGWHGRAATCSKCPADTYNPVQGAATCIPCPPHGTTEGSEAQTECKFCKAFRPHKGGKRTEDSACECPSGSAIYEHDCLECFAPSARCLGGNLSASYCAAGYQGPLCMRCSEHYYSASGLCIACSGNGLPPRLVLAMTFVSIGALLFGFFVATAFFVYSWSPSRWLEGWMKPLKSAIFAPGALGEWQQQLVMRQAPILLQMGQLWSVLSALLRRQNKGSAASSSLWEAPYMEYLQLAVGGAKEVLYLQCFYGGEKVRLTLALTAPMVPLFLLLCCVVLELFKRGSGVNAALKILTLLFVGGASKCAALISCQRVDAGGWPLQDSLTFLRHLPDLKCDSKQMVPPEVASVFWPCAVCYSILIPAFLMYLYARQHVVLRYTRMPLALTTGSKKEHLAVSQEDLTLQRRLLAGLVAYVSMLQHGSVRVQLRDGKGTVTFLDTPNGAALELDEEATKAQFTVESEKLRHHAIAEMLLERHVLDEVGDQDRLLLGAKETLLKYASCRDLWMEVVLKLVAVIIVQAVASSTATRDFIPLGKVLVATLAVAAAVWMVQPYAQPQVNDLQVCCFMGLAFAATGFGFQVLWLSRAALLMPLMLAAAQQMQPDSPESLAQRLWEAVASSTATNNLLVPMGKVLAATLAVAATVWMVQPYAQPQVNDLQVVCFLGLAFAAIGFGNHNILLSRAALLMPLVLAAVQQTQPDSPEFLAQRLWEELVKDGMPKESATTSMLTRRQSQAISFSLEN